MNEKELKEIFGKLEEQGWMPMLCDTPVGISSSKVKCGRAELRQACFTVGGMRCPCDGKTLPRLPGYCPADDKIPERVMKY